MADQEIALQVKSPAPPVVPTFNAATPLADAQTILGNQTALQGAQTKLQMLNRENAGQDIAFQNELIRNAAMQGQFDPNAWDASMREALAKGAVGAGQFIGRYSALMPERVFQAYGGATPAAGSNAAPAATSGLATAAVAAPAIPRRCGAG